MVRYRLAVGREHDVMPKHIVGAIANEAGLDSENIGRIELFDRYSTVELPEGMPKEIFELLRNVRVCGERLRIALADGFVETPAQGAKERPPAPRAKKDKHRARRQKDKGKGKGRKTKTSN